MGSSSDASSRFEIVSRLGSGGMAEVYLARDKASGEPLALKRVKPEMLERTDVIAHFRREARISASLRHPNIVGLRDFGDDDEGPWLALEYVQGRPLAELLRVYYEKNLSLPLAAALCVGQDAARGLAFAHGYRDPEKEIAGIIHRDVSAENVLVSFDGLARLSDFGIARWMGATVLTQTGMIKGKLQYMAPELYDGHEADSATDVFALGVTLYLALSGVRPFDGKNEAEIMRAVLAGAPAKLSALRPEVPESLVAWIHAALSTDRAKRPAVQTVLPLFAEALEALGTDGRPELASSMREAFPAGAEAVWGTGRIPLRMTRAAKAPIPKRRRRWVGGALAAMGVVTVCAVAAASYVMRERSHPAGPDARGVSDSAAGGRAPVHSTTEVADSPHAKAPAAGSASNGSAQDGSPHDGSAQDGSAKAGSPHGVAADLAPRRPEEPPATSSSPKPAVTPKHASVRSTKPSRSSHHAPQHVAAAEAESKPAGTGKLWLRAWPWAEVFVDGTPRGRTPLPPLEVPAGTHTVLLVNQPLGKSERRTVTVGANAEAEVKVVFDR